MSVVYDRLDRPLGALRISVTDRCNLRCRYCMPEDDYIWLPRESLLTFEEIVRVSDVFTKLGVRKIRLTGGEPLLRRDLDRLVAMLAALPTRPELALTTNGLLLAPIAQALRGAGLDRVTISLDTLRPARMAAFAKSGRHTDVLAGIDAALAAGFTRIKLNAVAVRGFNDDEVIDLVSFAKGKGIEIRFIEYMDVGGATRWRREDVMSRDDIVAVLASSFRPAEAEMRRDDPHAPAERFRFADGTVVGVIASTTAPFCRACDRVRITADGMLFLCLYADRGVDLCGPLRRGTSDADLRELVAAAWRERSDRGAELRTAISDRGMLVSLESLRADLRLEMHVRGG